MSMYTAILQGRRVDFRLSLWYNLLQQRRDIDSTDNEACIHELVELARSTGVHTQPHKWSRGESADGFSLIDIACDHTAHDSADGHRHESERRKAKNKTPGRVSYPGVFL